MKGQKSCEVLGMPEEALLDPTWALIP